MWERARWSEGSSGAGAALQPGESHLLHQNHFPWRNYSVNDRVKRVNVERCCYHHFWFEWCLAITLQLSLGRHLQ